MDTFGLLLQHVFFPTWEGVVRGRPTLDKLRVLERSEWGRREELVEGQMRDLRALCEHARRNVPHYRETLAGMDLDSLREPKDMLRLPLLTRADAQSSQTTRRSMVPPFVDIEKATSGTMGLPVTFGYDVESEYWRQAVRLRSYGWAGYRLGARTFHYWGPGAKQSGWRKAKIDLDHLLRRDRFVDCSVRSAKQLDLAIDELVRFRPNVIICFASAGADLARRIVETERRSWGTIPVICGAEAVVPQDRAAMVEAFGPEIYETYGSRETMLMGAECPAHDGLHVPMENVIVEVIVREGDVVRHAAPGEVGEIAVTDLHNRAMPFLRYLNGDRAAAGDDARCKCGRELVRLRSIEGRVAAMLRDVTGAPVSGLFVHSLLAHVGSAFRGFQVVQHAEGSITLRLVKSRTFDEQAHRYLLDGFAKYLPGTNVSSEFRDEIPVGRNGKRQVILRDT